jgi:uncharacterized membrane protein
VLHAIWNVIAKRAVGSHHFVWLYSLASMVIWAPVVGYALATAGVPRHAAQWLALIATGLLHLGYALALQAGYRSADLSIVYPIARGSGPLLSFVGAVALLGDPFSGASVLGLVLILSGMALVSGLVGRARRIDLNGVRWGLITGTFIAGYSLNDGWAVKVLLVSPLVVDYFGNVVRFGALLPAALRNRAAVKAEARQYLWSAIGVGALAPLAYILVLFAMKIAPVSHVAPARELATLIGTYLGSRILREAVTLPRAIGAVCVVSGIICLAVARY